MKPDELRCITQLSYTQSFSHKTAKITLVRKHETKIKKNEKFDTSCIIVVL